MFPISNLSETKQSNDLIYKRLFESANAPILILNTEFKFIDCNEEAVELLGMSKEEISGKTPVEISPKYQMNGEPSSILGGKYFSSAAKGKDMQFEWVHTRNDHSELILEVSLFSFIASGKKNFFVMWRDLTDVTRKKIELKESEERFRTIFSKATDGMLLHSPDLDSAIIDCNEAAWSKLGYKSRIGIVGKKITEISPTFQGEGIHTETVAKEHLAECMKSGKVEFEWIHSKKDGTPLYFDVALTKVTFSGKVLIHSVWRDITKRKRAEQALKKIAWLQCHRVRKPVAQILGLAELMKDSPWFSFEYLTALEDSTNKLDDVIKEIVRLTYEYEKEFGEIKNQ